MVTFAILIVLLIITSLFMLAMIIIMTMMIAAALFTEVPFVPVPKFVVLEAVKKFKTASSSSVFYDLGAGDGRVVLDFAAHYPDARSRGFEIGPLPYLLSRMNHFLKPRNNVSFNFKSFFKADLSDATHIFIYLFPNTVEKLHEKFKRELKPGTQVISCDFPFRTKEPTEKYVLGGGLSKHTLYVYEF
jgi:hypothetical protein